MIPLTAGPDIVPLTDHSLQAQNLIWDGGRNDKWDLIKGCTPGSHYHCYQAQDPSTIPNTIALANKYAISDQTYTCQRTASWSDKLTWTTACDQDGFLGVNPKPAAGVPQNSGLGCNSGKVTPWGPNNQLVPSCVPYPGVGPYGGAFKATPVPPQTDILQNCDKTVGCSWTNFNTARLWSVAAMRSYSVNVSVHNKTPDQFITDANAGALPSISYVTSNLASVADSEHNGSSMAAGDNSIGREVSAAMSGPDALSTAVFVVWDDCGCQYDPVDPSRVANIIISPYARAGFTDHTPVHFSAIQRLMEEAFDLPSMNANDAPGTYDFGDSFDLGQTPIQATAPLRTPVSAASATRRRTTRPLATIPDPKL